MESSAGKVGASLHEQKKSTVSDSAELGGSSNGTTSPKQDKEYFGSDDEDIEIKPKGGASKSEKDLSKEEKLKKQSSYTYWV